ncbi:MAG: winged helix-turn-helix domain-containing protein [Christensenellaceae bacterium]|nr:winged helix-turn-helix domain-containing protein [Christensenellaceae bacterium]
MPDYSATTPTSVSLFIPRGMPDEQMISMITDHQRRTGELLPINTLLVLNALRQNRRLTLREVITNTGILESRVRATVERLIEAGLIEAIGTGRSRAYVLSAKLYQSPTAYVRQTDVEQIRYRELILKLAKQKGFVTRKDVIDLLHVNAPQAYRLLKKLTDEHELIAQGVKRSKKYFLKVE